MRITSSTPFIERSCSASTGSALPMMPMTVRSVPRDTCALTPCFSMKATISSIRSSVTEGLVTTINSLTLLFLAPVFCFDACAL